MKYELAPDNSWIRCLTCGKTSHNPIDVGMRYCGHCRKWIGEVICDFCLGEFPLVKDYKAESRITGELLDGRVVTDGDEIWGACAECSALVEACDWEPLLTRMAIGCDAKWIDRQHHNLTRAKMMFCLRAVFGEKFTVRE